MPKSFRQRKAKKSDAVRAHRPQRRNGRPPPAAESDSRSSAGSFIPDVEGHKAQDFHSPMLAAGQLSNGFSTSLPSPVPPAVSTTYNTHPPNWTIPDVLGIFSTKVPPKVNTSLSSESVEVPFQEDVTNNLQPMLPGRHAHGPQDASGFFTNAHDITLNYPVMIDATNDNFMEKFAEHTIKGAELDSSARDPPPRCHPGTRVEIVDRMRSRLRHPLKRVQWLVGPAGVGKSAIMQTVAELEQNDLAVFAALFFSAPNGRNDPSKVVATLAYQIALRHKGYYHHIRLKVNADPKLWEKSIDVQFTEFIIKPFAAAELHKGPKPVLMFIDGLDECNGQREQIRILSLIFDFTTKYPRAPLLWVIASRPEAHITAYLNPLTFYDKEEVSVDSTEACQDAERFVRAELEKIRDSDPYLKSAYRQWPPENQLTKLLAAVLGLFVYAETAIRFIGDLGAGNPISRLQVILDLIDNPSGSLLGPRTKGSQPLAHLDTLYQYILSRLSSDNVPQTEEILAFVVFFGNMYLKDVSLRSTCNWMGIPANIMYGALRQLHSVISVPLPDDANLLSLRVHHKSFSDFLLDPQKSGLSLGTLQDEQRRHLLRSVRVLMDIPYLCARTENPSAHILLTWPLDGAVKDRYQRSQLHATASDAFQTMSSLPDIHLPQVAHALKVLCWDICERALVNECVYGFLFNNTHPKLSQLLREDGALQDIPVSLLDLDVIHKRQPSIGKGNVSDWMSHSYVMYSARQTELIAHLERAQAQPSHPVRVFIGLNLTGIVEFKTSCVVEDSPEPNMFFFMYDFATIYQRLKGWREGEGEKKDWRVEERGKGRRKRVKGRR